MIDEDVWLQNHRYSPSKQLVFKVEKAGSSGWIQPFFMGETIDVAHQNPASSHG